jgi:putative pyruvate formate lyase activating enzyme
MPYSACTLCPRACGINRIGGKQGFCGETHKLRIASACLHFGEEPPLVGTGGSGTIFVTGCNLGCTFCQNYQISQDGMGRAVPLDEFVAICLALQKAGALNVNIVTGSHAIPFLAAGLAAAKNAGLSIPVCWNTSSYESPQALSLIAPYVDIWLPDLKTLSPLMSEAVFAAPDYPDTAQEAIRFMIDNAPLRFGTQLLGGVIIRHLFLPGRFDDTAAVLDWLKANADGKAYISLMTQYTPIARRGSGVRCNAAKDAPAESAAFENRFVQPREETDLRDIVEAYAFEQVFFQELVRGNDWLPDFSRVQPFSSELAKPVWHWTCGFAV